MRYAIRNYNTGALLEQRFASFSDAWEFAAAHIDELPDFFEVVEVQD